jgi:hypothetical protein
MKPETMVHILATDDELAPSSGFMARVMERVREEAAAPPPIPFPWKRAAPGIALAGGVLGWGGFELVRHALPAARQLQFAEPHFSMAAGHTLEQAGWVAFALAASLLSWFISSRMVRSSSAL